MRQFQYNKTELLNLDRELKVRLNALPTLQSKEAALRAEVKRIRMNIVRFQSKLDEKIKSFQLMERLWCEFPPLVKAKQVRYLEKNIAGVRVDIVGEVEFETAPFSVFGCPSWFLSGIEVLKNIMRDMAAIEVEKKIYESVEYARRKTTQKVNLYVKVQIPAYEEAIRRIKRFLEDEETISKSSQKILKNRMEVFV